MPAVARHGCGTLRLHARRPSIEKLWPQSQKVTWGTAGIYGELDCRFVTAR
jgi:hypothetical protein